MSTATAVSERERAKQIIAEIIRQAGGVLSSKAELLRLFWRAHLVYAESRPDYLSFWPVVKTDSGPAIQDADRLLAELVADGTLRIDEMSTAGVTGLRLELTGPGEPGDALPADAVEAIRQAIAVPGGAPDLTDYASLRCWSGAAEGEELNIYLDVIPEAEYTDRNRRMQEMSSVLKDAWE